MYPNAKTAPAYRRDKRRLRTAGVTSVLDEDAGLADGLDRDRLRAATGRSRAAVMRIPEGSWDEPEWPTEVRRGPGLLVLDGLLLRHVGMQGRVGAELLGAGDVLRPWQREDAVASVARQSGWRVLEGCRIALLNRGFAARIAAFPEIHAEIVGRALRRSRQLAVNMAIVNQPKVKVRMHMLLWHLADRFGKVRPGGAALELPLTHAQLAELVAARRPTVSAALAELEREGAISHERGTWILHGAPPGELLAVSPAAPR